MIPGGEPDLEVNLSGQPGLRTLDSIPRPGKAYGLITSLLSTNAEPPPRPPATPGWTPTRSCRSGIRAGGVDG